MAFNKVILMLAIIAVTGIFEATCLPQQMKDEIHNSTYLNKCRKDKSDLEFQRLLETSMNKVEMCAVHGIFTTLLKRGKNAQLQLGSVASDFPLFCEISSHIITCSETFINELLFCDSQLSLDRRNLIFSAMRKFGGYLCSEKAERVAALVETKDCISNSYDNATCLKEIVLTARDNFKNNVSNELIVPQVDKCISQIFDQCPSSYPLFSPSTSAQKFMADFRDLGKSIAKLGRSTDIYDMSLNILFQVSGVPIIDTYNL